MQIREKGGRDMLNTFTIGAVGSTGLSDIVSFFNSQSSSGDVSGALGASGVAFKVAMFFIMFVGAIAMAIWIARIGVDILLLVLKGTTVADKEGFKKLGTGKGEGVASVADYLKGNLLEIILVIILITFLMTGWLFRIIAIALSGFGVLGNKLLGLDIESAFSAVDAAAYAELIPSRRTASLKVEYDEVLGSLRASANELYEMAKDGKISDDPKFMRAKKMYSVNMAKAQLLSVDLTKDSRQAHVDYKIDESYFSQHLRGNGDGVCNGAFVQEEVIGSYAIEISEISCTTVTGM